MNLLRKGGKFVVVNEERFDTSDEICIDEGLQEKFDKMVLEFYNTAIVGFKGANTPASIDKYFDEVAKKINGYVKGSMFEGIFNYSGKDKVLRKNVARILLKDYPNRVASDGLNKYLKKLAK